MSRSIITLVLLVGSIALVVLLTFQPQSDDFLRADIPAKTKAIGGGEAVDAAVAEKRFELTLKGGALLDADERLQVRQGDKVRIMVHSDIADELHLHGYDLSADLSPGETATLAFTAEHSGRFEAELHHRHKGIFALEVNPR